MRASLHRPQRNWGPRLREYDVAGGLRAVFLENELLRVGVLADRGTDVFELLYKPRDLDFAWLSANGVRSASWIRRPCPSAGPRASRSGFRWLEVVVVMECGSRRRELRGAVPSHFLADV